MDNAHICQLHYKIAWVHHERPNFFKSIYAVLKILDKEPHLLKCGSRHAGSTSINVVNDTLSMVPLVWLLHENGYYLRLTYISMYGNIF